MPLYMDVYLMYLRKSRADIEKEAIGQHETLAVHRQRLSRLCRERGYFVEEVFEELVSGESVSARVEFQRLMERIQTRRYAGVIVHALDRLGRGDMMEYGWILSTFQYTGTLIVTPERTYDPNAREDLQILQLQMFFANDELSRIKKRLVDGKESHAMRGEHIAARAPLGYRKVLAGEKRKTLEPDEWAPTVAQIYRDVAAGEKLWTLSCRLSEQGVPGSWHNQRIKSLIRNPVYKGKIAWNQVVTVVDSRSGMDFKKKRRPGKDRRIEVEGLHPAIVDDELWNAANAMIGNDPRGPRGPLRNPLAGLLRCARCGRAMYLASNVSRGRRFSYYRHPHNLPCTAQGAPMQDVVGAVLDALETYASPKAVVVEAARRAASRDIERGNLEKLAAECDRRCGKLMELYMAEGISATEYRERREAEEARKAAALARLRELGCQPDVSPERVSTSARAAMAALRDSSPQDANDLLKSFVERIDYRFEGSLSLTVVLKSCPASSPRRS